MLIVLQFTQAIEGENYLDATDVNATSTEPQPYTEFSAQATSDVMLESHTNEPPVPRDGQDSPKL